MTEEQAAPDDRYESFAALRVAHAELSRAPRTSLKPEDMQSFLARAAAAGAFIADEKERKRAQDILDFWSAELIGASDDANITPASLAPHAPELAPREDSTAASEQKLDALHHVSRQQIRLSATARLWRDSGRPAGYLLKGRALEQARNFTDNDEDIRELVRASDSDVVEDALKEKQRMRRAVSVLTVLVLFLAGALVYALVQRSSAREAAKEAQLSAAAAHEARTFAEGEAARALVQKNAADEEAALAKRAREVARAEEQRAREQLRQLTETQKRLDAAMTVIRDGVRSGALARDRLPAEITALLDAAVVAPPTVPLSDFDPDLAGYDEAFLGEPLPLPGLSADQKRRAFAEGQPTKYLNYSLVLDGTRRLALFGASNLDRSKRIVLPRQPSRFVLDPRVPPGAQPLPAWFDVKGIDRGHLVSRHEISWGSLFAVARTEAAARLSRMIDVATNTTPQFDAFNQGVWADLESWIMTEHNSSARLVSIFTGPVLAADDPVVGGVAIPRAYWKIAVSTRAAAAQKGGYRASSFVVDAFMIRQYAAGPMTERVSFDPAKFRVTIRQIEQATGLDLAPLRESDRELQLVKTTDQSEAARLAQRVNLLDSDKDAERKATVQQLVDVVRDKKLPDADQRVVAAALVDMADEETMLSLSATGRYNLLYVLSEIPRDSWDRADWRDLRSDARVAVSDLERAVAGNQTQVGPDTRRWLDQLKGRIGLGKPMPSMVNFQFAGMTREDAVAISQRVQALGWKIPGEERTGAAAGQNEVRFGAKADQDAAELLAADLKAAGVTRMTGAKLNAKIKPGTLEIWVSR